MASSEGVFSAISVAAVVEDVLRRHGTRLSDTGLASRKAEEAATRRYEAAGWLRKMVGVVSAKDLPEAPSEEEFRLGLRNGMILCTVLNKIHPGAVPKVVVNPGDSIVQPDGAALSAYQYFENVRNFLVAIQEIGLPTFEASDLEQGGKSGRVVDCVLAMKSYGEWKQMGGNGSWKYGGNLKPLVSVKPFFRKNSEPFKNSLSRSQSMNDSDGLSAEHNLCGDVVSVESNEMATSRPLKMLVNAVLSDKRPEEVPLLIESMLSKLVEEFEQRLSCQNEMVKTALKSVPDGSKSFSKSKISTGAPLASCEKRELKRTLRTAKAGMEFMQMKYSEEFSKLGKHVYGLAHAASGYHKVLEENRKLYNQVQDLKGSIRVYCRVRPFLPGQLNSSTVSSIDDGTITIINSSKYGKEGRRSFTFNKVFGPSATQDEVFLDTQPLIRSVLDGYNVCIFAYGQTGSGKTYTMSGPRILNEQTQGVNFRALGDLFKLAEQRRGLFSYEIAVQMIEIYNEQVRDLLVSDGLNRRYPFHLLLYILFSYKYIPINIPCGASKTCRFVPPLLLKGLNVPDANLVPVASTSDVMELMSLGQKNRAVGATALNDRSSRSHSCLTVHVLGRDMATGNILRGCMHLVDLAGSERVDKSEVTGERLKEAQHINKSLSALGDVIASLAQKNSHVPYRNSKLTQLLQDSLGGQAKTLMFVHISPEIDAIGETISTLKFAERVSTVELGAARVNKESNEVRELKEQISCLKSALAMKEAGSEHLQNTIPTPEHSIRASSPVFSNRRNGGDYLSGQANYRQPMEDVGNIEVRSNPPLRQKKPSFDLQELLATDPPPWPDTSPKVNFQIGNDKEMVLGEWVDKVMVNKHEQSVRDENPMEDWEREGAPLPDFFYQRYCSDTRAYSDQLYHRNAARRKESHEIEVQRTRFYSSVANDDSDELDIATSDSSEADMLWQFNFPNINSSGNEGGSMIKKPQKKTTKSPDIRTPVHTHIPSPSRKMSNGSNRSGRQLSSGGDGKRTASSGKMGNMK
ncbi:Kinesin-4 [Ananas comosus]|uniref:Kinesin-4 n=1 Tax=Ananas comosus TaxID=4615 RepID=A0A199W2L2_ANACO|nr:Kinesin-4 [Ananas comosus]